MISTLATVSKHKRWKAVLYFLSREKQSAFRVWFQSVSSLNIDVHLCFSTQSNILCQSLSFKNCRLFKCWMMHIPKILALEILAFCLDIWTSEGLQKYQSSMKERKQEDKKGNWDTRNRFFSLLPSPPLVIFWDQIKDRLYLL